VRAIPGSPVAGGYGAVDVLFDSGWSPMLGDDRHPRRAGGVLLVRRPVALL